MLRMKLINMTNAMASTIVFQKRFNWCSSTGAELCFPVCLPNLPSIFPKCTFFSFFFIIHLFYIVCREGQGRYELLTMVGAGGTRTCVHPHVSSLLYHCATDAKVHLLRYPPPPPFPPPLLIKCNYELGSNSIVCSMVLGLLYTWTLED